MSEGSDALLDRLDRAMKDEFVMPRCWDAWAVDSSRKSSSSNERCAGMSKRCASVGVQAHDTSVTKLAVLLGLTDTRAATKTRTPGTKATGGGARDVLEPLDAYQAATFRSAVGLIGYIVLDRPDCQYAAKAVRSATTEPTKLDWMRMMRLAKFLVAQNELEWLYHAQDVKGEIRSVWRFRLGKLGSTKEHNRSIRTARTAPNRVQLLNSVCRRSLERRG